MITGYEIKQLNDEQILYLYFDMNDEFAKFKMKEKIKKLEEEIKEYIEKNKIIFKGTTIGIIASGMLIGTLSLKPNNINPNLHIDSYVSSVYLNNQDTNIDDLKLNEESNMKLNDNLETTIEENTLNQKETVEKDTTIEIEEPKTIISDIKEETLEIIEHNDEKEEQNIIEESNNYINIYRQNGDILIVDFEEYIIGVVGAEMPASFNIEALKAQAVIARTYATKVLSRNGMITDSSSTQNYKTKEELMNLWGTSFNTYYSKIKEAVDSTKDIYLTYNGEIIDAVYHSTSNGRTEDSINVWGNYFPYLVSVDSIYDETNQSFYKEKFISYNELSSKLQDDINIETQINILNLTSGNRVNQIEINNKIYTGIQIRNLLGLRSTDFEIIKDSEGIIFKTKGYGHGVGLSQYGANGMANNGYNYEQILKHYYNGVTLSK